MFTLIKHPLSIGLTLLLQTLLICTIRGIIAKTFWFSYVLFLIFLGGMLVLFIYVTSLASNEIFNFSLKLLILNLTILILSRATLLIIDQAPLLNYIKNYELTPINLSTYFLEENSVILNKLYNFPINLITIILMIYLFLTLIAIVKITNIFEGPLRPNFN